MEFKFLLSLTPHAPPLPTPLRTLHLSGASPIKILKGLHHSAQGCDAVATLGCRPQRTSLFFRLVSQSAAPAKPTGKRLPLHFSASSASLRFNFVPSAHFLRPCRI